MFNKSCCLYFFAIVSVIWNLMEAVSVMALGSYWQNEVYIVLGVTTGILGVLLALGVFLNKSTFVLAHIAIRTTWLLLAIIFSIMFVVKARIPVDSFGITFTIFVFLLLLQFGVFLFYKQMTSEKGKEHVYDYTE